MSQAALQWYNSIRHTIKTPGESVVLLEYCLKADAGGACELSAPDIVRNSSFSATSSVSEAIKRLVKNGLIFNHDRNGKKKITTLNMSTEYMSLTPPETGGVTPPETGGHPTGNRLAPHRKPVDTYILYSSNKTPIDREGEIFIENLKETGTFIDYLQRHIDAHPDEIERHCKRVGKDHCFRILELVSNDPETKSVPALVWHKVKKANTAPVKGRKVGSDRGSQTSMNVSLKPKPQEMKEAV